MITEATFQRLQGGFWSKLSLPVVARWIVFFGVSLRFLITYGQYTALSLRLWLLAIVVLLAYTVASTILSLWKSGLHQDKRWHLLQVLTDTAIFSVLYMLTGSLDSGLFLLYFLPLLTAADHFSAREVFILFILISLAFISTVTHLAFATPLPAHMSRVEMLVRNSLPQGTFFLYVLFLVFMRASRLKKQSEELEAIQVTAVKITKREGMQSRLEAIMEAAVELLKAKGCKVYLRMPDQDRLELVAFKGLKSERLREGYLLPFGKGMAGEVISTRSPLIENDYPHSCYRVPEFADLFQAMIQVPLFFEEEPIGVLAVLDDAPHRQFTDRDIPVLERLAQYAAVAIHDVQLVEKVQRQTAILQILNAASWAMNANLELKDTLQSAVKYAWELAAIYATKPPLFTYLGLLSADEERLEFKAAYPECHLLELTTRVGQIDLDSHPIGIVGRAIRSKSTQLIRDITRDVDYIEYSPHTRSQLAVPVKIGESVLGVISIEHSSQSALPGELQANVEVLAAQAAMAIRNACLFEQIGRQHEQAEKLRQASVMMTSANGLGDVAQSILEALNSIVPYDRATLQIVKGDEREIVAKHNLDDDQIDPWLLRPISKDDLIRQIVEHKKICILAAPECHPYWQPVATTSDIKSWVGIPLLYRRDIIGLITVDHLERQFYGEDQGLLLELFSREAASVLQNAILFQQNTERIEELSQTKDYLQDVLDYLENQRNLALIGLVYGESIHYAKNQLGMAKARAANIVQGFYDHDLDELKRYAATIVDYINNYLQVLNDTQNAVLQSPAPVDLHRTLDYVIGSKRISLDVNVVRDYKADPVIYAPEQQLRQVFYVIVQNALDAMEGKGTLGLKTETVALDDENYVQVSVSDTGTGIPRSKQRNLFNMRESDSSRRGKTGTGMGLVWARSFMRSYGGDINFKTALGRGTTMHILVPTDFRESATIDQSRAGKPSSS
jgi:GAF domain-containing protein